ncbi:MAG: aminotransferase class V-fold PLP-dependent enzyme [Candidatus Woesearchaeota archaeon]|nr:aminotransferase class V-fold PLP-dependent enzyme [Candidatus Woesearchaeota archaeon]
MSFEFQRLTSEWEGLFRPFFREEDLEARVQPINGETRYIEANNAGSTKPSIVGLRARETASAVYTSPHSQTGPHAREITRLFNDAVETLVKLLKANDKNLMFMRNTSDVLNEISIMLSASENREPGVVAVERTAHSAQYLPWGQFHVTTEIETDQYGRAIVANYRKAFQERNYEGAPPDERIKLAAVTLSSNTNGDRLPAEIVDLARRYNVKLVADGCQDAPHHEQDTSLYDFYSLSAHKLYARGGPGVGAISKKTRPVRFGGNVVVIDTNGKPVYDIDEDGTVPRSVFDLGTIDVLGVIQCAAAYQGLHDLRFQNIEDYEQQIMQHTFNNLKDMPGVNVYIPKQYGALVLFDIDGLPSKLSGAIYDTFHGINLRSDNFCSYELMRRFNGMSLEEYKRIIEEEVRPRITKKNIPDAVRVSWSIFNRPEDIILFLDATREICDNVRKHGVAHYENFFTMDEKTGNFSLRPEFKPRLAG